MNKPKMVMFDYGQTLVCEKRFNGINGTRAVLESCVKNPMGIKAEQIQALADSINEQTGRFNPEKPTMVELHNHIFQNYLYEYFGIERTVSPQELETVFWQASSPGKPTEGISEFLEYLWKSGIETAVISNITYSGKALENRIKEFFPQHKFKFIMESSEYIFRKPHPFLFQLALKKAGLSAAETWYCGDNVFCDIEGAAGVGIFPVWYTGAAEREMPAPNAKHLKINSWSQAMEEIEGL